MKNTCIFLLNEYTLASFEQQSLCDIFRKKGYAFREIRVVSDWNLLSAKADIDSCISTSDNVFVAVCADKFTAVCDVMKDCFDGGQRQVLATSACYSKAGKSVFIACMEGALQFAENTCIPYLQQQCSGCSRTVFRMIGANEAHLQTLIAQAKRIDGGKARYAYTRRYAETALEIFFDSTISKRVADDVARLFADGLKDCIYALEDSTVAEQLVSLLRLRGKKLSVAESFTGGGIAKRITSVAGASEVYFEGLNTYNELSKMKRLGVSDYTLNTFGAVSDNTAYEMAAGLIAGGDCDLAIATTGLAGPKSDRSMLPVGLCYIAVGTKERVLVYRYKFDGTREQITETAMDYALFLAFQQLKEM